MKRLTFTIDAPDAVAEALLDESERPKYLGPTLKDRCELLNVEVVEPVRRTRLTLEVPGEFMWHPGELVFVLMRESRPEEIDRVAQAGMWCEVAACEQIEIYETNK